MTSRRRRSACSFSMTGSLTRSIFACTVSVTPFALAVLIFCPWPSATDFPAGHWPAEAVTGASSTATVSEPAAASRCHLDRLVDVAFSIGGLSCPLDGGRLLRRHGTDNAGPGGSAEIPIGLRFDAARAWGPGRAGDSCLRPKGFQPWSRALILVGGLARASAAVMHGCRDASTMEMHQVRYFLTVARTLNFTRAAEQCNVSQPALTRAIRQLEEELGGDLLRREGKLSHLTELGQRMLPLMQQCYDSALAAKSLASSLKKGVANPLALGLSHTIDMRLLTPVLTELQRAVAGLQIKVLRGNAGEIAEALQKGRVEFAIAGPLGQTWDRLEAWPLFDERFELAIHRDHPLANAEAVDADKLAEQRLLISEQCELANSLARILNERRIAGVT